MILSTRCSFNNVLVTAAGIYSSAQQAGPHFNDSPIYVGLFFFFIQTNKKKNHKRACHLEIVEPSFAFCSESSNFALKRRQRPSDNISQLSPFRITSLTSLARCAAGNHAISFHCQPPHPPSLFLTTTVSLFFYRCQRLMLTGNWMLVEMAEGPVNLCDQQNQ